ncbi:uncharacterized protein LOC126324067 [Schistocerca gregaria]|uniref:uncharacterized protein LOC126324067 n=1 Tax=Schistocerca gregaria TaxID=7010 RepID=UPI00211F1A2D|nr:uncharacterized protein LOC126324067 [Schistocerca gregaria]
MKQSVSLAVLVLCSILAFAWCGNVLELDSTSFYKTLAENDHALVSFYVSWWKHWEVLEPEYEQVAKALRSENLVVAKIDTDKYPDIRDKYPDIRDKHNIEQHPVVKLFSKKNTLEYEGDYSHEEIVSWVKEKIFESKEEISEGTLVTLTDKNFDSVVYGKSKNVLVDFYAPWCGYCKRLEPIWRELAKKVSNKDFVVAQIDADKYRRIASKYEINSYPTIKLFNKEHEKGLRYTGANTIKALSEYAQGIISKTSKIKDTFGAAAQNTYDAAQSTYEKASNKTKETVSTVKGAINGTFNKGHDILANVSESIQEKFPEIIKSMKEYYREYSGKLTEDQRAIYDKVYTKIIEHLEKNPERIKEELQKLKEKGFDKLMQYIPTSEIMNALQPLVANFDTEELDEL